MISEEQARALLRECERRVGRELRDLRARLGKSQYPLGALWELVTLYVSSETGEVDHEPAGSMPDVLLCCDSLQSGLFTQLLRRAPAWFRRLPWIARRRSAIWIEATHIQWPEKSASEHIGRFIMWIRSQFRELGLNDRRRINIRVEGPSQGEDLQVPLENEWASLRKTSEWRAFLDRLVDSRVILP